MNMACQKTRLIFTRCDEIASGLGATNLLLLRNNHHLLRTSSAKIGLNSAHSDSVKKQLFNHDTFELCKNQQLSPSMLKTFWTITHCSLVETNIFDCNYVNPSWKLTFKTTTHCSHPEINIFITTKSAMLKPTFFYHNTLQPCACWPESNMWDNY
jgi:hypothetical protein